jgi:hypothetical protein
MEAPSDEFGAEMDEEEMIYGSAATRPTEEVSDKTKDDWMELMGPDILLKV